MRCTTNHIGRRRFARCLAILMCLGSLLLATAPVAGAAETIGAGYTATGLMYPDSSPYSCPGWSGGADANGVLFIPCGAWIYRLSPDGTYLGSIEVPAGYTAARDVAVTADGSSVYFTSGPLGGQDRPDPAAPNVGKVVRLNRDAAGSYVHDPAFNVGPFQLGAGVWSARNVEVDLSGRVYVTVNAFVFIFDAAGARIGAFGGDKRYDGANYLEGLEVAQGLAVTPDGSTVYVVEQQRNHVQRWTRAANGVDWVRVREWVLGALGPASDCVDNGTFASPYDVGLDGSGNIYVLDVSCRRVQKYDAATRAWKGSVWRNYPVGAGEQLFHGLAVNFLGTTVVPQQGRRYTAPAQAGCGPDAAAPAITRLGYPTVIRSDRKLVLTVTATDDCTSVAGISISGDASSGGWIAYRPGFVLFVTPGDGVKTLQITVRDGVGRTTEQTLHVPYDSRLPVLQPRKRINVAGPAKVCGTSVATQRSVRGTRYRVLDTCAALRGKVVRIRRQGATQYVLIRMRAVDARALYQGVSGPVDVWVIGQRRTPSGRGLRVGSRAAVVTAIALDPGGKAVSGFPAFRWDRV